MPGRATILAPTRGGHLGAIESFSSSGAFAARIFIERHSALARAARRGRMRRLLDWFHRSTSAPARSESRSALYEEARRLGIEGRSRMDRRQLEEAIASARRTNRSSLPARLRVGLFATHAQNARLRIRAARLYF